MMRPNAVKRGWTEIVCDGCGIVLDPKSSAVGARQLARAQGWASSQNSDYCRLCCYGSADLVLREASNP